MKSDIFVNLEDLVLEGNVLDISLKGNTIVSEIVSELAISAEGEKIDKDFVALSRGAIPCDASTYDFAVALFSIGTVNTRYKLRSIFKEVARVLKGSGKFIIWDLYIRKFHVFKGANLKVLLPGKETNQFQCRPFINITRPGFESVINILEKQGFKILNSRISGQLYYIEAEKTREDRNEDNTCSA